MNASPSAAAWLIVVVAVLLVLVQIRQDRSQYPRFKAFERTEERQAMYRLWLLEAFYRYGLLGVGGLLLMRRADALWRSPADFMQAVDADLARAGLDPASVAAIGGAIAGGLLAGTLLACMLPLISRRLVPPLVGDIAALLPRNAAEMRLCGVLALNAGVGEEVFFRLLLPLAWWQITGDATVAVLAATLQFSLAHAYQGVAGLAATAVLGLLFAGVYLTTRQLWLAMLLHVMVDLRALLMTPWAARRQR